MVNRAYHNHTTTQITDRFVRRSRPSFFNIVVQPKLTVSQSSDVYEQEAGSIANKVMRIRDNNYTDAKTTPVTIQKKCEHCEGEEEKLELKANDEQYGSMNFRPIVEIPIQRKCAECEEEELLQRKEKVDIDTPPVSLATTSNQPTNQYSSIQRQSANTQSSTASASVPEGIIPSGGQPLDHSTRTFMEEQFNYDFSNVRVHNNDEAHESSRNINALAYTYGKDIVFGADQYRPDTYSGKKLLAHELTHVIQQSNGGEIIQRVPCTGYSFKTQTYVSVANEHNFAALDGYTPIKGRIYDVLSDGNKRFFCYKDKKIFIKYKKDSLELIPDLKTQLEEEYKIKIVAGVKAWSDADLVLLEEALSKLSQNEIAALKNYRFQREKGDAVQDGKPVCGLHEADVIANEYVIHLADNCMKDPEKKETHKFGINYGTFNILHEIGHAMAFARTRPVNVAMVERNAFQKAYDKASAQKKKEMEAKLKELKDIFDRESKLYGTKPSAESQVAKLTKGKPLLTDYAGKNEAEGFAEAFAIFKANPTWLEGKNNKLFEYFKNEGFL